MSTAKRILFVMSFVTLGAVLAFVLNFFFLEHIIIPDPCYYHVNETNRLFDVFYVTDDAGENGHPFPTVFNIVFTLTTGAAIGLMLSVYMLKMRNRKSVSH